MPATKIIFYEGNDDKAVLERLQAGGLLSREIQIAQRDPKHSGKDGLVQQLVPFVRPVNGAAGRAIAMVDLDDLDVHGVRDWFEIEIRGQMPEHDPPIGVEIGTTGSPRVFKFDISSGERLGHVALVAIGRVDNQQFCSKYGVEEFAIDDHVLQLACDPAVYAAIPDFKEVEFGVAMNKLTEMADLLRRNGLPVRRSKRYLHLLRAIVGFRASSATFIERLVGKAFDSVGKDRVRELLNPLVDDLEVAENVLDD